MLHHHHYALSKNRGPTQHLQVVEQAKMERPFSGCHPFGYVHLNSVLIEVRYRTITCSKKRLNVPVFVGLAEL